MCGLVGIIGALQYQDEEPMKKLLLSDYFRGKDSTGLAAIRSSGDVKIAKMSSHPIHLFETPKFKDALNANASCAFLGHNRAATRGEVNDYNAHPYQFGHIVGAHNGTLFGLSQDRLEKELGEKFPVDSMALIAGIAELGVEKAVGLVDGSYAITWVDLKDGTFNVLRNKERPLWHGTTEDDKFLFYASEWPILTYGMNGEYREMRKDKQGCRFFSFAEDFHYKFSISDFLSGKRQKPTIKKVEGKKYVPLESSSSSFGRHTPSNDPWKKKTTSTTHYHSDTKAPVVVNINGTKDNPYAGYIEREKFESITLNGCTFCENPINWGDMGITVYVDDDIALCPEHSSFGDKSKARLYVKDIPEVTVN